MFDPTAFENMKVVLEGALYDRDLQGEISILDRNDLINLAKLSRQYEITFSNRNGNGVSCTFILKAALENLSAELYSNVKNEALAGAKVLVVFKLEHENNLKLHQKMNALLIDIWGSKRTFTQKISYNPLEDCSIITKEISLDFNRLVLEDQIDDLLMMLDYIIDSLQKINSLLS